MTRTTRDPVGVGQLHLRTKVLTAGKTATGIQIPDEMIDKLGAGRKPAVRITINGFTYRSTVAVMNGRFMVGINAENREKAKVAGGDTIDVGIALDTEVREVAVPADFREVLEPRSGPERDVQRPLLHQAPRDRRSHRGAKTTDTRERRIEKAVRDLKAALDKK